MLKGLKRLEYRGYDSAGDALVRDGKLQRVREVGKVVELADALEKCQAERHLGIAHNR